MGQRSSMAKARAKARSRSTSKSSAGDGPGYSKEQSWRQASQPTADTEDADYRRKPNKLATNHDKRVIHVILRNGEFLWLLQSHDLFRTTDAIRGSVTMYGRHT